MVVGRAYRRKQTQALIGFQRIQRQSEKHIAALLDEEGLADITPAQANALLVLFEQRTPITARELADRLAVSEVTVARFVRAMQTAGWIDRQRDPADSRAYLLHPSTRARKALPRFIRVSNRFLDQLFADLPRRAVVELVDHLEHLQGNLASD